MRNWFVGLLFAVSISLGLCRGYSRAEDLLLDGAAALGIGIAIFPMDWNPAEMTRCGVARSVAYAGARLFTWPLHGICAIAFFLCIALVCWFCADDILCFIKSQTRRKVLKGTYRTIALLMPTMMFAAWGLNTVRGSTRAIFWVEFTGIAAFGIYWLLKSIELYETGTDWKAALGMLRQDHGEVKEVTANAMPQAVASLRS